MMGRNFRNFCAVKPTGLLLFTFVSCELHRLFKTHRTSTHSTMLQTANKFKKSFQSETKQIKNIIAQNIKENGNKKDAWTISTYLI
jgi:hypothetical protein